MKLFEVKFKKKRKTAHTSEVLENNGWNATSLVASPAIEESWILHMSKETEINDLFLDKQARVITGPLLIPDKKIYRCAESLNSDEDGYIFFSKKTIKDMAEDMMVNLKMNNITINHNGEKVDGIKLIELWLVRDENKDAANALGMKMPVGTCMGSWKIFNDDILKLVENGELTGFSIEANGIEREEVKMQSEDEELSAEEAAKIITFKMLDIECKVEPEAGETEEQFIGRCVKEEIANGYSQEQSLAICYSKYENKK